MKKLLIQLVYFGVFLMVFLELFLNITNIATDIPTLQRYDNGYILYEPNQTGTFTRGYRGEVSTSYHINSTGWNSICEYENVDSNTIALLGDSFIEGFYVDVHQSIGRKIEQLSGSKYKVHEYAKSGANIHDYRMIYSAIRDKGYKAIFININVNDLMAKKPSLTDENSMPPTSLARKIYTSSAILRYLNVNIRLYDLFKPKSKKTPTIDDEMVKAKLDELAPEDAIYLYVDKRFEVISTDMAFVKITHNHQPYHYGFNKHWNENGALNLAETIVTWLEANKSDN